MRGPYPRHSGCRPEQAYGRSLRPSPFWVSAVFYGAAAACAGADGVRQEEESRMSVRDIIVGEESSVLRQPAAPVTRFDDELARLVDDLFDTML